MSSIHIIKPTHKEYICAWMADRRNKQEEEIVRAYEAQHPPKKTKVEKEKPMRVIKW